jgi:hypothetical protein
MLIRRSITALLAASAISLGLTATMALPANAASYFRFEGNGYNECLQPSGSASGNGVAIVQELCDGSEAQNWAPISLGGNNYQFLNQATGECMDARGGATAGVPVQQWTCTTISNEKWSYPVSMPSNFGYPVTSRVAGSSSFCLDGTGTSASPGLQMRIETCGQDGFGELWIIG